MSEFSNVKFAKDLPHVPLFEDSPPHKTITCPLNCGFVVRVRTDQVEDTLRVHTESACTGVKSYDL